VCVVCVYVCGVMCVWCVCGVCVCVVCDMGVCVVCVWCGVGSGQQRPHNMILGCIFAFIISVIGIYHMTTAV
jgi:hypothetical protein